MVLDIVTIAASLVSVLGVIALIYQFYRWTTAPKFIIGVLPKKEEMDKKRIESVGERSFFDEVHYKVELLAQRIKKENDLIRAQKNTLSSREVRLENDILDIPIVVQNVGKRNSTYYSIGIGYDNDNIRLVDIQTETLEIGGLYVQDKSVFKNSELVEKIPRKEIRLMYNEIGLTRDYLNLYGELNSYTFEMIYLKILIPEDCNDFNIVFRIDCPSAFLKRFIYAQHIKVERQ